jgi:hypothetical protein
VALCKCLDIVELIAQWDSVDARPPALMWRLRLGTVFMLAIALAGGQSAYLPFRVLQRIEVDGTMVDVPDPFSR